MWHKEIVPVTVGSITLFTQALGMCGWSEILVVGTEVRKVLSKLGQADPPFEQRAYTHRCPYTGFRRVCLHNSGRAGPSSQDTGSRIPFLERRCGQMFGSDIC